MPKRAKKEDTNYTHEILELALSLFEENKESLLKKLANLINFRKVIKQYVVLAFVALAALFIILDGLGLLVSSYFPGVRPGIVQILMGLIIMLAALAYKRLLKP